MDIVVASTEADLDAVEAIREHHAAMAGALGGKVTALQRAAHRGEDAVAERDAVVAWARQELLPHAAAEEATIYAAAAERAEARLLVEALVADHRVITDLVDRVAEAPHAVAAAGAAFSREQLFLAHMAKENDQVLPFLAAEPSVSLASLLDGMHHELGHEGSHEGSHEHAAAEPGGSGCGGILFWRSGKTVDALAGNLDGMRALLEASKLAGALPADQNWMAKEALFEFSNAANAAAGTEGPIADMLADPGKRAKLAYFSLVTSSLSEIFGTQLSGALGLTAGFSSLDGD